MAIPEIDQQRIAYHEAGHAVIQQRLGWGIRFIAIGRPAEDGHRWTGSVQPVVQGKPADAAVIAFAGPLAEASFLAVEVSDEDLTHGKMPSTIGFDLGRWERDAELAREFLGNTLAVDRIRQARAMVGSDPNWIAISALATELCTPARLTTTAMRNVPEAVREYVLSTFRGQNHDHRPAMFCCIAPDEASRIIDACIGV